MDRRFDADAIERVVRRALDLTSPSEVGLSEADHLDAVRAASAELGLDPAIVSAAVLEERLGALDPSGPHRVDRWLGPTVIVEHRVVDGEQELVRDRVDRLLRVSHGLARSHTEGVATVYRRRRAPSARATRAARAVRGVPVLRVPGDLAVAVGAVDEQRSVVAVRVNLAASRSVNGMAGAGVAASGVVGSATAVLVWHPVWLAAAAGSVGGGYALGRAAALRATRASGALRALLDEVERGRDPLVPWQQVRDALVDRLAARGAATARQGRSVP